MAKIVGLSTVYAQEAVVLALKDSLEAASSDQHKVDLLNSISVASFDYDLNLSQESAEEAKALAGKIDYQKGVADANRWLGKILDRKSVV